MKIKANLKKVSKYTDEEKYQFFVERKNDSHRVQENKKKYSRKDKSWKKSID